MSSQPLTPFSPAVLDAALRRFGHDAFRPGQREAIETILAERRLLLVAPTGGGKSLIYQLPATLLTGTTLVVSPLVSLMHDQVAALGELGVRAAYLNSTLSAAEAAAVERQVRAGDQFSVVDVQDARSCRGAGGQAGRGNSGGEEIAPGKRDVPHVRAPQNRTRRPKRKTRSSTPSRPVPVVEVITV